MRLSECCVFFLVTTVKTLAETASQVNARCLSENTYGYGFVRYFRVNDLEVRKVDEGTPTPGNIYIEFYVKAVHDAHIFLAPEADDKKGLEIVLGAVKNTFSQVRLVTQSRKRATKTSLTDGILSAEEFRGFWIELSDQQITVGRITNRTSILQWNLPWFMEINYISFCTWTNVMGAWKFACPKGLDEGQTDDRNLSAIQRLRKDLFTYYDPNNVPDGGLNQTIEFHIKSTHFRLDEIHGKLFLSGITDLKWTDHKLKWNLSDYNGINSIFGTPHEIWTPNIHVLNSVTFKRDSALALRGNIALRYDGTLNWRTTFHSATFCHSEREKWPFNAHSCTLVLGFLTEQLNFTIQELDVTNIRNLQWDAETLISYDDNESYSLIQINLVRRDPATVHFIIQPSYICAAVLSLLSFWMSPQSPSKLFLNCGSVAILIFTVVSLKNHIPATITTVPEIVKLYALSVLVMCIPILFFIGLRYFPYTIKLPRFLVNSLTSNITGILFCIPELELENNSLRRVDNYKDAIRLAIVIERIVFWIYLTVLVLPFISLTGWKI